MKKPVRNIVIIFSIALLAGFTAVTTTGCTTSQSTVKPNQSSNTPLTPFEPSPQSSSLNTPSAALDKGDEYYAQKQWDLAIAEYTKALDMDPKYAEAYNSRGVAYGMQGNYDTSIADITKAIELDPTYAAAYNNRAVAYYYKANYDKAIADCTKAIEFNPRLAAAYNLRGFIYQKLGEKDKATADLQKAQALGYSPIIPK